jgi:hypothetical protein
MTLLRIDEWWMKNEKSHTTMVALVFDLRSKKNSWCVTAFKTKSNDSDPKSDVRTDRQALLSK